MPPSEEVAYRSNGLMEAIWNMEEVEVKVAQKFDLFSNYWNPKIAAGLNDSYIKLMEFKGELVWHYHEKEDELFFMMKDRLAIKLRDGEVRIRPGEFVVIPRRVDYLAMA